MDELQGFGKIKVKPKHRMYLNKRVHDWFTDKSKVKPKHRMYLNIRIYAEMV